METIEIKPDVMVLIIQKANDEGKSVTEILDELLRSLLNGNIKSKCHNCRHEIDYEINGNKGYCDYCESVVFIERQ